MDTKININTFDVTVDRLIKQGDERVDAINDWNLLVNWVNEYIKKLKDLIEGNDFASREELEKLRDEFDKLMVDLETLKNYIISLDIEGKYEDILIRIADIENDNENINVLLDRILELLGNPYLTQYYKNGVGYVDIAVPTATITIDATITNLQDHLLDVQYIQIEHIHNNGIIMVEGVDYTILNITNTGYTAHVQVNILDNKAFGTFGMLIIYNGFAVEHGLVPLLMRKDVFNLNNEKVIDYSNLSIDNTLNVQVNGVTQVHNLDYDINYTTKKITFRENQIGVVYITYIYMYGKNDNKKEEDPIYIAEKPTLALKTDLTPLDDRILINETSIHNHSNNLLNPHNVSKDQIGLQNVDNTGDLTKPISAAQQAALDLKQNIIPLYSYIGNGTPNIAVAKDAILNIMFGSDIKIATKGDNISEFKFNGHNIIFPKLEGLHYYCVEVRYTGVVASGNTVTTGLYLLRSTDYTGTGQSIITMPTNRSRRINYDPTTNIIDNTTSWITNTDGINDPFSVGGMTVGIENRSNPTITINTIRIAIKKL